MTCEMNVDNLAAESPNIEEGRAAGPRMDKDDEAGPVSLVLYSFF